MAVSEETGLSTSEVEEIILNVLRRFLGWLRANVKSAVTLAAVLATAVATLMADIVEATCKASKACGD